MAFFFRTVWLKISLLNFSNNLWNQTALINYEAIITIYYASLSVVFLQLSCIKGTFFLDSISLSCVTCLDLTYFPHFFIKDMIVVKKRTEVFTSSNSYSCQIVTKLKFSKNPQISRKSVQCNPSCCEDESKSRSSQFRERSFKMRLRISLL
jgi:hypothetical protein